MEKIVSDNGKQFTVKEYQNFAVHIGLIFTTSSPCHPQVPSSSVRLMTLVNTSSCWN